MEVEEDGQNCSFGGEPPSAPSKPTGEAGAGMLSERRPERAQAGRGWRGDALEPVERDAARERRGNTLIHGLFMCCTLQHVEPFGCCGQSYASPLKGEHNKGRTTMVTKISTAIVVALVAFLAAPTASFAASKKSESDQQSQSTQRGPYTPDIKTTRHGASRDFQGGSIYYKRSKTRKHGSHSPANS